MGAVAISLTTELDYVYCCHEGCDAVIIMPAKVMRKFRENHEWWYCYNGHVQHFTGASKTEKLKAELEREKKRREWAEIGERQANKRADHLERSRNAYKGKLNSTKKRIKNGVCPCCNRQFKDLQRHMKSKHPDYKGNE